MKLFYIPDGHRRYADREGCTLAEAYHIGYRVLLDEIIRPLFREQLVTRLDIFLLSNLNLDRRDSEELKTLLETGEKFLINLIDESRSIASINTLGSYLGKNLHIESIPDRELNLILGSRTADDIGCTEVDLFLRSGGELRLSGAPRTLIGDYTQFYAIDKLHPELTFDDIYSCVRAYHDRYMRETSESIPKRKSSHAAAEL